jgi:cytochrome c peroxidase
MARFRILDASLSCSSLALVCSLVSACSGTGSEPDEQVAVRASSLRSAREVPPPPNPPPLSTVPVPVPFPSDVVDNDAAIRLGKALFWDVQVGGDGQTACASCHFHAGADNRRTNTVNPGGDGIFQAVTGPGATWNGVSIGPDDDDRVGSQGVVGAKFNGIDPDPSIAADDCDADQTPPFGAERRVTGRNAPSVIGAVFFRDNFWDGRANHHFNGLNPFGFGGNNLAGSLEHAENASLASQSVGPPNNEVEMSCLGRVFDGPGSLGSKLLARVPLGQQQVSPDDGVLGPLANPEGTGLRCGNQPCSYGELIAAALGPDLAGVAEAQFSRIFGQALAAYEATLIPDQTPFDRFLAGDGAALTASEQLGWQAFNGDAECSTCHAGSELSDATLSFATHNGAFNLDGGDQGFHNLGVRPTEEDLGRAGTGPGGVAWSESGSVFDRGAFKTPGLRNVALTAPYMHNGGISTLAEVVDFYHDRGFFANPEQARLLHDVNVKGEERGPLTDFLTGALTDCRVELERAPFDHPSLPLPNSAALDAVGQDGFGPCP